MNGDVEKELLAADDKAKIDAESEASIDAFAARDAEPEPEREREPPVPQPARLTRPALDYAAAVYGLRDRPHWSWGFPQLDQAAPVPTGSLVYLIGATGRGKSSFALQVARQHAETFGPALVFSAELAAEYACARLVSQVTPASWYQVIRGGIDADAVHRALDVPRLRLTDSVTATWARDVEAEIRHEQRERPGELVLVIVDYLQVLRNDARDTRERVAAASTAMREIAARTGAVILALSKANRLSAKGLRSGELVGSDATEAGAETNSIEHDAVAQVQLGVVRDGDDSLPKGVRIVELSVAKARFGREDTVIPFQMDGAHGWFREHGAAETVIARKAEAKAKKDAQSSERRLGNMRDKIVAVLENADGPLGRAAVFATFKGRKQSKGAVLRSLIEVGDAVEVVPQRSGEPSLYALTSRLEELNLTPVTLAQA